MAVRISKFWRVLLSLKAVFSKINFSKSSINSIGKSAAMNALTVIETSSGSMDSGKATALI